MKKTKLHTLINPTFNAALNDLVSKELPAVVSFQLSKILREVREQNKEFQTTRMKLLQKYCQKDSKGNLKTNKEKTEYVLKDKEGFDKEYNELINLDIQHDQINLDSLESISVKPETLQALVGTVIKEP